MNQKNIFTAMAALLTIQAIGFYFMGSQIVTDAFGDIGASGNLAAKRLFEVMAVFTFNFALIAYPLRSNPQLLAPFTLGFAILVMVTLKHMLVDKINVPIWAIGFQIVSLLAVGYLWMQHNKAKPA